ncbi:hypothetical protein [Nostoc sp. CHAB 5715]|uniref:hypothetical protein n=1 Tax=Nostoc sp. CHAB 5715 TaxID=2780400 RepID=UPI001E286DB2|nr:hypothetical protein [Nostoc sp. CHAB 5715]
MEGGTGEDLIFGDAGNDNIDGGEGSDRTKELFNRLGLTQKSPKSLIYRTAKTPRTPRIRRACVSPTGFSSLVRSYSINSNGTQLS